MIIDDLIQQTPLFQTERTAVILWSEFKASRSPEVLEELFKKIMVDDVTRSLPDGWQGLSEQQEILDWFNAREKDSAFFIIQLNGSNTAIGFLFLYEEEQGHGKIDLRLGYLLDQEVWGIGLGSELIRGLTDWCASSGKIGSISGGVEQENIGSIKVLEKNGFERSNEGLSEGMLLFRKSFV